MEPFLVVHLQPLLTDLSYLIRCLEQIGVEHLFPVSTIEALDEGIPIRLARQDVDVEEFNIPLLAPIDEVLDQ